MKLFPSILLSLILTSPASAAVLAAAYPDDTQQGLSFQQNQYIAQKLSLGVSVDLTNVALTFHENPGASFAALFQIVDHIGVDATDSNVLFGSAFSIPAGTSPATVDIPLSKSLNAGVYYLLISTTEPLPLQTRLATGSDFLADPPGVPGSVYFSVSQNVSLPAASPFAPYSVGGPARFAAFKVDGRVVPEPRVLYMIAMLLPAAASVRAFGTRRFSSRRLRRPQG